MYFSMKSYLKNTRNHTTKHAHTAMEREVANKLNKKNKEMVSVTFGSHRHDTWTSPGDKSAESRMQ